jgi:hypothetical protein
LIHREDFKDHALNMFHQGVTAEVERIIQDEIKKTVERVNEQLRNSADIIALKMFQYYDIEKMNNGLVITVRKEPTP